MIRTPSVLHYLGHGDPVAGKETRWCFLGAFCGNEPLHAPLQMRVGNSSTPYG